MYFSVIVKYYRKEKESERWGKKKEEKSSEWLSVVRMTQSR